MRLAIFWHDILHYHAARIRALGNLDREAGNQVQAFILCATDSDLRNAGYGETGREETVRIFSDDPLAAGEFSQRSKGQLLNGLDEFNPDAVAIIGYTGVVSRAALGWCRYHRRGAILMLSSHAADYKRVWWKEWPKQRLVSLYDAAFVSGQPQADYARQLGFSPERITAGYAAVDNEFWRTGAELARKNIAHLHIQYNLPERYFLTACRFVAKKNLAGLLRAYAQYREKSEAAPWSLVLVGDGPLMSQLQQLVHDLNLTDCVHFLGYLPADEMTKIYGAASAFVLASSHAEQWGLVVNEAMAAGLPVLVSNICGCVPDLVKDNETGFAFDPKNEDDLVNRLLYFSSGKVDLAAMGRNGQQHVERFSPKSFAENLFAIADVAIHQATVRRWPIWPSRYLWI